MTIGDRTQDRTTHIVKRGYPLRLLLAFLAAAYIFEEPVAAQTEAEESRSSPSASSSTSEAAGGGPILLSPSDGGVARNGAAEAGFETLPASPILIVNVDRIYRESAAGRSISAAEAELVKQAETELRARRDALTTEEQALAAERDTLSPSQLEERTAQFRASVAELRQFRRERGVAIQKAVSAARVVLKQALQPVLVAIMRERRAAAMLDARNVVLSASALDITDEAIRRLDAAAGTIEVRIEVSNGE